jgi:hypothetical protein
VPGLRFFLIAVAVTVLAAGCGRATDGPTVTTPPAATSTSPQSTVPSGASVPPNVPPAAVDPDASVPLIDHVHWATTAKGAQLQVVPTAAGRTDTFAAASERAWREVLADAPNANTPGMYDQFLCHWNFARLAEPDKPSWDLEPWRPAVGYEATVDALCNPGGSEG